jgi:2-amino-4-hydroxy-6-hydroxymethyldihydropteridine diphosphokinase
MTPAYLALGSNLDDPPSQLCAALMELAALPHCHIDTVSSAYSSAAVGPGNQSDYLNAVLKLSTSLGAVQLLSAVQTIETKRGRVRGERWAARTLDIDILLFGDEIINTTTLQVPHPRMAVRNFVLYPLAEITKQKMVLPSIGVLGSLLAKCPRGDLVKTNVSLRDLADSK